MMLFTSPLLLPPPLPPLLLHACMQALNLENYQITMWAVQRASNYGAVVYTFAWIILGNYIFLTLFLAVMLEAFEKRYKVGCCLKQGVCVFGWRGGWPLVGSQGPWTGCMGMREGGMQAYQTHIGDVWNRPRLS
jgi:hypothetical protein